MKSFLKTLALLGFIAAQAQLVAQVNLLQQTIEVRPGSYKPDELIQKIEDSGFRLSYPSALLTKDNLELKYSTYSLETLLQKLFNPEYSKIILRGKKILVAYKDGISITYSGYVEEKGSGERLIGVNIYLKELKQGTVTNEYGFYSITVPLNTTLVAEFSFIGYATQKLSLEPAQTKVDVSLQNISVKLEEATVSAEKMVIRQTQMSQVKLNQQQLEDIPAFFGEADVLKAMHFLPGVQMASEGNTNFLVRGGSADQNLILLDGVPVYNASHLFGFFSVFNSDAVKNVELTKGGFPARFGGRLSSVLEVNMKEGDMQEYHGSGGIGLLSSDFTLEGPIVKNKTSFMVSGRRTYSDLLYRPFLSGGVDFIYYFGDLNLKLNHKFSRKDRLYLSFYQGRDKIKYEENPNRFGFSWGNYTGVLRWNHLFNDRLFSNLSFFYTRYKLAVETAFSSGIALDVDQESTYFSSIQDMGIRYDFEYNLSRKHNIEFGLNYTFHDFKPGILNQTIGIENIDAVLDVSPSIYSHDIFAYLQDEWQLNERFSVNMGLHGASYFSGASSYNSLQPRFSALYQLTDTWSLKTSAASMQQFIHLLANPGTSLPTDIWVSSSERVAPQESWQIAFGTAANLFNNKLELQSEVYYKGFSNLIDYKAAASSAIASNWEDQILTGGIGNAYGLELLVRKSSGKLTGWLAYGLGWSNRQFDEINDGEWYPFTYDRRHDLKISFKYRFSPRFDIGANWVYSTGRRGTIPISNFIDADGQVATLFTDRNAYVYPSYHRLDISFNFPKKTSWGRRVISFGAYNIYNRQNPFFVYFTNVASRNATQLSLFPVLPYFTYQFQF